MATYSGVKIKMNVRVIDEKTGTVYLPTDEYECKVEPPPYCYDRPQVLAIQAEAMAKIKYVNFLYTRILNEADIKRRLGGRKWKIDAIVTEQSLIPDYATA